MNNIKNTFSIQDLEIFSGIKAHTIRIWEKRYNLLNPSRLNRNIRVYNLTDLQKILNITLLYNNHYKISKISKLTDSQLEDAVKTISINQTPNNYYINSIIISMYSLDTDLFEDIYLQQIEKFSFEKLFVHTYLPILYHLGVLWQTDSIKPAHEHFISNLIYQKIVLNTSIIPTNSLQNKGIHVLFLPDGEIHELGLLFLNYYLKSKGEKTIYLGRSIPFNDLFFINSQFKDINWVTSFIIDKPIEEKEIFFNQINQLLEHTKNSCWIIGKIWSEFKDGNKNDQIVFYKGFEEIIA
jgi:DNA-binding transcriptional MerR regulator